ncbi:hypothetical protein T8833_12925 [Staphylococcus aureus]|nr:hypothetical protein T8833_12925 [Staphylococcus aureus]
MKIQLKGENLESERSSFRN